MIADRMTHDQIRKALDEKGLRCTAQRLAVYDEVASAEGHPTAEDVYRGVRARLPKLSLATVYNALDALVAAGIAARLTAADGSGPACYDVRPDNHYHFRCLRTGEVLDLPIPFDPDLLNRLDPGMYERLQCAGFQVTGYRLELIGYQVPEAKTQADEPGTAPTEGANG